MARSRKLVVLLSGMAFVAIGVLGASAPALAGGFCCRPTKVITLVPTPDGKALGLTSGRAEIDECLGMSFLRVVAIGRRVPDGTQLIPVLPGAQPLIGEWFTMTSGRGETVMPEISATQVIGAELDVSDESFTPLLIGQF